MAKSVTDERKWIEDYVDQADTISTKLRQNQLDQQDLTNKLLRQTQETLRRNEDLRKLLEQSRHETAAQKQVSERCQAELAQTRADLEDCKSKLSICNAVISTLQTEWKHKQEIASLERKGSFWESQFTKAERDLGSQAEKIRALEQSLSLKRQRTASETGNGESGTTDAA